METAPIGAVGEPMDLARTERPSMDEASFEAFYDRTSRRVWAYLARASGNASLADDLTQEAYLRYLGADFEPESEAHGRNYLFRIAANLLRDHFRRGKWRDQEFKDLPVPERSGDVRLRRDLGRLLGRLKPRDRQLLWLAHVEGHSHREIAEILGLKERSIRLLVFRARKRLAEHLREEGIGPEVLS